MHRFIWLFAISSLILITRVSITAAHSTDVFEFFDAEAKVVSASLEPQVIRRAPATVYVVNQDEIRASGSTTLWDALRLVPGVDVISTRAHYAEVSIRGMDKPFNNRTLVLLDGKTVLNGYFDFVNWEAIPVSIEEIDRIEIVEGPASALYGANAINGVINIITKSPEQLRGLQARIGAGEYRTRSAALVAASAGRRWAFRASGAWHTGNQFEDEDLLSSEVGHAVGLVEFRPSPSSHLSLSGGLTNVNTQLSAGVIGTFFEDGTVTFLRADGSRGGTRVRAYWNRGRTVARELSALSEPDLRYDTYDVNVEQTVPAGPRNGLVVGGSYRQNVIQSQIFGPDRQQQDLWALFLEDRWAPAPKLSITASARLDSHPFAGKVVSPRASVMYEPGAQHVLRASISSAFRNPTLTENYVIFNTDSPNPGTDIPNPPYSTIRYSVLGNRDLDAEKMLLFEVAHSATLRRVRTTAVGFRYRLQDIVTTTTSQNPSSPPTFIIEQTFINRGVVHAWGGELGVEAGLTHAVTGLVNYSYQSLTSDPSARTIPPQSPRHKANAGFRYHHKGRNAGVSVSWVDRTRWPVGIGTTTLGSVRAYTLLNASASATLGSGLTLGVTAFNIADDPHHEILGARSPAEPGQYGEMIGRRVAATLSYRF